MRVGFCLFLFLICFAAAGQPAGDNCSGALPLCSGQPISGTTAGATTECGGAEGDCLSAGTWGMCNNVNNSIWLSFTTNSSGGNAQLNLPSISCSSGSGVDIVVIQAQIACDPSTYTSVYCSTNDTGDASVSLTGLLAETVYYVQIDGAGLPGTTSDCEFEVEVTGPAVQPQVFSSSTPADCQVGGGSVVIDSVAGMQGPFTYSVNNGPPQSGNSFLNVAPGGYQVTVTDANGCQATTSVTVPEENNYLEANAGEGATLVPGNQYTLNGSANGTASYWSPASGLSDTSLLNPVFTATSPGIYTYALTTVNAVGCINQDQVEIIVLPPLVIFNSFSPNGDGINDTWEIRNAERYPDIKVAVFSRWGQRLFYQEGYNNIDNPFNGLSMGAPLPSGVYYYAIDLNSGYSENKKAERLTGSLTILR